MTSEEYTREVLRTYAAGPGWNEQLTLGALGLAGETGEVVDAIKKHLYQGHPLVAFDLVKELGDVLWYLTLLSYSIGSSLDEVMQLNVEKLHQRYPAGFDPARSLNR